MIDDPWLGTTLLKPINVILQDHVEANLQVNNPTVTVIISLLNEMSSIETLLVELSQQTCLPAKVIIVDGGSVDGTWEFLQNYYPTNLHIELHQFRESTPAQAMNYAMKFCGGDLVVFMNAGCQYTNAYIEQFALAAEKYPASDVFCGTFEVESVSSYIEDLTTSRFECFTSQDWQEWLPSIRSFCLRIQNERVWPEFPEWLSFAGEDTAWDVLLRNQIDSWVILTNPNVKWFAPSVQHEYQSKWSRYFRGDGESGARDPYLYPLARKNPRDRFLSWYWIGFLDRPFIDVNKRGIVGVFLYCSSKPLASSTQLEKFKKLIHHNFRIVFVPVDLQADSPTNQYPGDFTLTTVSAPVESEIVQLLKTYTELGVQIFSTLPIEEGLAAQSFYQSLLSAIQIVDIDEFSNNVNPLMVERQDLGAKTIGP